MSMERHIDIPDIIKFFKKSFANLAYKKKDISCEYLQDRGFISISFFTSETRGISSEFIVYRNDTQARIDLFVSELKGFINSSKESK